jgi:hypothetical protein
MPTHALASLCHRRRSSLETCDVIGISRGFHVFCATFALLFGMEVFSYSAADQLM